ncbi:hypothetical protein [Enterococcus gallinarum]|uniref:hypothetical protein n=1 Tax=Enterococcus gallinarum TaxID=1353 RepID=UPI000AA53E48|nr:hypothetical protein [Enterococcus gallinarum]
MTVHSKKEARLVLDTIEGEEEQIRFGVFSRKILKGFIIRNRRSNTAFLDQELV